MAELLVIMAGLKFGRTGRRTILFSNRITGLNFFDRIGVSFANANARSEMDLSVKRLVGKIILTGGPLWCYHSSVDFGWHWRDMSKPLLEQSHKYSPSKRIGLLIVSGKIWSESSSRKRGTSLPLIAPELEFESVSASSDVKGIEGRGPLWRNEPILPEPAFIVS